MSHNPRVIAERTCASSALIVALLLRRLARSRSIGSPAGDDLVLADRAAVAEALRRLELDLRSPAATFAAGLVVNVGEQMRDVDTTPPVADFGTYIKWAVAWERFAASIDPMRSTS